MFAQLTGTSFNSFFDNELMFSERSLKSIFNHILLISKGREQTPIEPTKRKIGVGHDADEAKSGGEPNAAGNNLKSLEISINVSSTEMNC